MTAAETPNPGSDAALAAGCTCPVEDNRRGWGAWGMEGCFWRNMDCPLHGRKTEENTDDQ